ncbi:MULTISPECIES: nickel ABC transporter substrate-binding protein [Paenibacillus]|uniref:Peptide/nickel transport system substrate-binding protein n=1 Tax=Paenibacillus pabuli TaxID=1472 RepID=A0A855Y4A7_9BACL|nr:MULTISPECIES: nickel ABC transporter substrate-binding protein [Paenibacillus]PWW37932.1 peptide/nickel transport system substrate-binding protein [Paenibacillus pabuli]PXW08159.1 peptide/nickel transport system substrate-binding protein [Paenibacillus taichungensis]RAI94313.1 peptide/nickel transport system substrate-binding protein [Paenibacillus pabuli]
MNKKTPLLALVSLALSAGLLSACGSSESSPAAQPSTDNKNVHFLYNFSTSSLDPHVDSSYVPLRAGITETLVRLDEENLTVAPWLAESWESEDGQHWTIDLRDDVTFQNGKPMTGESVKASLERALEENVAIQNALKIDTIEAEGDKLEITTTQPFPEFASELVNPNTAIIDVSEPDVVNKPIGTGPFKLTSFTPGSKLELDRYDEYWDGASPLDSITFSFNEDANARTLALKSGQVDIVYRPEVESLESLKAMDGMKVESTSTFRVHQLTMNMQRESMKDLNVRRALDALIDRQGIVDTILLGYGEPAIGPFLPSLPFAPTYTDTATESGADVAVKYLNEAGYTQQNGVMTKDGKPLQLTLLTYSARADLPLIAQVFQSDAKKIGIDVQIRQIDTPEDYMASNRDWDIATYSNLTAPRGDAGYYLNATYHPKGALNFSGSEDPELTKIIDELNLTVAPEKRAELAEKAANYVHDNVLNSFVLHPSTIVAYNGKKIKNWVTTRSEYYMITNKLDVM